MRAWRLSGYGDARTALSLVDRPEPEPGPGEVRVAVHAAGLNPIDYKLAAGQLRIVQALEFPVTPGFDLSGVVSAVGTGVTDLAVGAAVYGRSSRHRLGAFAESAVLEARWLAPKPAGLSHLEAASLPLVALTTMQGFADRARVQAGQSVLILAGAGGVGTFAIQYARMLGLEVTATTSCRNADFVRGLGAQHVICYDQEQVGADGRRYDVVYDTLGGRQTGAAFGWLNPGGCVVSIAGPPDAGFARAVGAGPLKSLLFHLAGAVPRLRARFGGFRYFRFLTESDGAQLATLNPALQSGAIRPVLDRTFGFEQLPEAFGHFMLGRSRGKVVVQVRADAAGQDP